MRAKIVRWMDQESKFEESLVRLGHGSARLWNGRKRWFRAALLLASPAFAACVSLAEFRKLEDDVWEMKQQRGAASGGPAGVADLSAELDSVQSEISRLRGEIEVAQHQAQQALNEAQKARRLAAGGGSAAPSAGNTEVSPGAPPSPVASAVPAPSPASDAGGVSSAEVEAYRAAYAAWRGNDTGSCIDRFKNFLQTYPNSVHSAAAAYWLGDCYFKKGDYKTAVLRFDDVVARYPKDDKAPDALYRQGEALLRLGPGYSKAAGKAFERVVKEYPSSERAKEAKRQLELLQAG